MGRRPCSQKGLLGSPALWLPVWLSHLALISPAMRVRPCRAELVLTSSRPWLSQMGSYMNSPVLTKLACPLHHKDENGLMRQPTRAAHVTLFDPELGSIRFTVWTMWLCPAHYFHLCQEIVIFLGPLKYMLHLGIGTTCLLSQHSRGWGWRNVSSRPACTS